MSIGKRICSRLNRMLRQSGDIRLAYKGDNVTIHEPYSIYPKKWLFVGSNTYIGPNSDFNCLGGVRIGSGVCAGPRLRIYSANHRYEGAEAIPFDDVVIMRPVDIKDNVWIGGDVIILPGVTVGEGAVIAGAAVVVKDVPDGAIVGGFPARIIKFRNMDRYYQLKAEGKIFKCIYTDINKRRFVGKIPDQWYLDAKLPMPHQDEDIKH